MEKKVSLLIPVYNVESFLDRCIQSIFNQTYKNIEIVLVDDCSTDNSLSMCYEYAKKDNRIKILKMETHTIVSNVRNLGIENATGEYVMFVDSDDFVHETYIEDMVNAIETNNVDVVRCKAVKHRKDGSTSIENLRGYENRIVQSNEFKDLIPHLVTMSENIGCFIWALIIKRSILNVKFDTKAYCISDSIFYVELLLKSASSIYFLDKPLYEYCFNKNSITNDKSCIKYAEGFLYAITVIKQLLKEHNLLDNGLEKKLSNYAIDSCFGKIHTLSPSPIFNIYKTLKQILKTKEFESMYSNMDNTCLNTTKKIRHYLVKWHQYFLMALYVKFKH